VIAVAPKSGGKQQQLLHWDINEIQRERKPSSSEVSSAIWNLNAGRGGGAIEEGKVLLHIAKAAMSPYRLSNRRSGR
jgi:hypothetical protein